MGFSRHGHVCDYDELLGSSLVLDTGTAGRPGCRPATSVKAGVLQHRPDTDGLPQWASLDRPADVGPPRKSRCP